MLIISKAPNNELQVYHEGEFICRIAREAIIDLRKEFPELGLEAFVEYIMNILEIRGIECDKDKVKKELEGLL
jgi:hypothetical protein